MRQSKLIGRTGRPRMGGRGIRGFTLIELMVVVAVIAILAAIAYPSYQDQVRKGRRGVAKADLVEYAQLAERFHTVNNTYDGFVLRPEQQVSPREGGTLAYRLAADNPAPTQSTFTITATPQGGQVDDDCGTLSLNQAGVKTTSSGTLADCW